MKIKILTLMALFVVPSVVLMGAIGSAGAADEWFVLGEQAINSADPSVTIKSETFKSAPRCGRPGSNLCFCGGRDRARSLQSAASTEHTRDCRAGSRPGSCGHGDLPWHAPRAC